MKKTRPESAAMDTRTEIGKAEPNKETTDTVSDKEVVSKSPLGGPPEAKLTVEEKSSLETDAPKMETEKVCISIYALNS